MRTSKVKIAIGVVLALAFFAACNAAVTFALEPYGSKSELTWADYHEMESMDTLVIGSSLPKAAYDPYAIDDACGTTTFNLSSPSQTLEESLIGIRTAYADYGIKRVILGLSCSALTNKQAPSPDSAFLKERRAYVSAADAFATANEVLWRYGAVTQTDSINFMFPWIQNHVTFRIPNIQLNIENKLSQADLAEAAEQLEPGWRYIGRGHGAAKKSMGPNSSSIRPYTEAQDEDVDDGLEPEASSAVVQARMDTLHDICAYCEDNGIDLIVTSAPLTVYDFADPKSHYFATMGEARSALESWGQRFFDFNCLRTDLFVAEQDFFSDNSHLNLTGCKAFNKVFAQFLNAYLAGEDVSGMFLEPDQRLAEVDYVSAVFVEDETDEDGIHLHCRSAISPDVQVEYQLRVRDPKTDELFTAREFSTDPDITYKPESHGKVTMYVNARVVGSTERWDKYREMVLLY